MKYSNYIFIQFSLLTLLLVSACGQQLTTIPPEPTPELIPQPENECKEPYKNSDNFMWQECMAKFTEYGIDYPEPETMQQCTSFFDKNKIFDKVKECSDNNDCIICIKNTENDDEIGYNPCKERYEIVKSMSSNLQIYEVQKGTPQPIGEKPISLIICRLIPPMIPESPPEPVTLVQARNGDDLIRQEYLDWLWYQEKIQVNEYPNFEGIVYFNKNSYSTKYAYSYWDYLSQSSIMVRSLAPAVSIFYDISSSTRGIVINTDEYTKDFERLKQKYNEGKIKSIVAVFPEFFEQDNSKTIADKNDDKYRSIFSIDNRFLDFKDDNKYGYSTINEILYIIQNDQDAMSFLFGHEMMHIRFIFNNFVDPLPEDNKIYLSLLSKLPEEEQMPVPENGIVIGRYTQYYNEDFSKRFAELSAYNDELDYIEQNGNRVSDSYLSSQANLYYIYYLSFFGGEDIINKNKGLCKGPGINCDDEDIKNIRINKFNCVLNEFKYRFKQTTGFYDILKLENGNSWMLYDWIKKAYVSLPTEIPKDKCSSDIVRIVPSDTVITA
ncbi:MAG: hypothetical protein KKF44_11780 [Nanoarchaeota archaeon]|nr:hypothetical protein [Nanoarchaeota archaeon]